MRGGIADIRERRGHVRVPAASAAAAGRSSSFGELGAVAVVLQTLTCLKEHRTRPLAWALFCGTGPVTALSVGVPRLRRDHRQLCRLYEKVSALDKALIERADNGEMGLLVGCNFDLGPDGLNMYVRATRAGDSVVSEARFCQAEWEDHG